MFDIWNQSANTSLIHLSCEQYFVLRNGFDEMIPAYKFLLEKGNHFYVQGFDSHTYLDTCKNEACFNILSILTSFE